MTALGDWQTGFGKSTKFIRDIATFATGAYLTDRDAALAYLGTVTGLTPGVASAIWRANAGIFGLKGYGTECLAAHLPQLGVIMGYPETDPGAIWGRFFEDAGAAPYTVKSRQITYTALAAGGSNIGNGIVERLYTDRFGYAIENCAIEAKTATCIADEHGGTPRWQERFLLRGAVVTRDQWAYPGAGSSVPVTALSIADSARLIQNPGFDQYDSTSKFPGWKAVSDGSTMANFTQDTARYYKDILPATNPGACIIAAGVTDALYQTWSDRALAWPAYVPMYAQVAYMRRGSATGTLYLQIGSKQVTVDLSTKTNDQWNVLRWPATTPDKYAWLKNFNAVNTAAAPATNPFVKVGVTSLATGTCLIDDLIVGPYSFFDGTWAAVVPGPTNSATTAGAATPFLRDDVFSGTDSSAATGKIQEALALYLGVYAPSVSDASQTWAEPA